MLLMEPSKGNIIDSTAMKAGAAKEEIMKTLRVTSTLAEQDASIQLPMPLRISFSFLHRRARDNARDE